VETAAKKNRTRRILISQHATITLYRVRFYELLEQRRPRDWEFDVVFDTHEAQNPRLYVEPIDWQHFPFSILDAHTHILKGGTRGIIWQSFFWRARKYDAVITDNFVAHLTYLATHLWRLTGTRRAAWGHTRDRQTPQNARWLKQMSERFKRAYFKTWDFFFAYTEGEAQIARGMNFPGNRIAVLNNTIDITAERAAYEAIQPRREQLRADAGFAADNKVLLYVGRLIADKRIDFLAESFAAAWNADPTWRLVVVGAGPQMNVLEDLRDKLPNGVVTLHGAITDRAKLAPIYAAADLYIITGMIGLAPMQAMCYDLPIIGFALPIHSPEIEYLSEANSVLLPSETTPADFAARLPELYVRYRDAQSREKIFASIAHLTMENMVDHFIDGVNRMLALPGRII